MSDSTIYKKITEYLTGLIEMNSHIPDFKLPSERKLVEKFNASRRPVRLAYQKLIERGYVEKIHGKGHFTKKIIEIDKSAIPERGLKNIFFITPSVKSVFMRQIIAGIETFCEKNYLDLSIKISDQNALKEKRLIKSVPSSGIKGFILFPIDNEYYNNELLKLSWGRFPITIIDRHFKSLNLAYVATDNYNAMVDAVNFLYRKNFKNILFVTSPPSLATTAEERINGFNHGLFKYYEVAKASNLLKIKPDDLSAQKTALINYLKKFPETEIIIATGAQAAAVIAAARELDISIPEKLKLMVFDSELSDAEKNIFRPYIIEQDGYSIGYEAAAALHNQIYGDLRIFTKKLPATIIDCSTPEAPESRKSKTARGKKQNLI